MVDGGDCCDVWWLRLRRLLMVGTAVMVMVEAVVVVDG